LRQARDLAVTALVVTLLGLLAGVVWSLLAPRTSYTVTDQGLRLADPTAQTLIAADGWFAVVTGAVGLACGVAGYLVVRRDPVRNPVMVLLGLAAGGLAAPALALWVGRLLDFGQVSVAASGAKVGSTVVGDLVLTAPGVLLTWPLLAVGAFGAAEAVRAYRDSLPRRPDGVNPP
jgi:hypothetical protein